jgi:hypothetical protein
LLASKKILGNAEDLTNPNKSRFLLLFDLFRGFYLITDHTANGRAANCANRAAAGQDATGNSADASADCGVFVLVRHAGATGHGDGGDDQGSANGDLFEGLHEISPVGVKKFFV